MSNNSTTSVSHVPHKQDRLLFNLFFQHSKTAPSYFGTVRHADVDETDASS